MSLKDGIQRRKRRAKCEVCGKKSPFLVVEPNDRKVCDDCYYAQELRLEAMVGRHHRTWASGSWFEGEAKRRE